MNELKKGDIITLKIENLAYGGRGIAKHEGIVVFIPNSVPGDVVEARVDKKKKNYAEATILRITEPSVLRIEPRCPIHDICGGCVWQFIPYEKQLIFKESILTSTIEHLGRQSNVVMSPIIPSPDVWHYRNKMEFAFGTNAAGEIVLGLHQPGSFHAIVDVRQCFIHPPAFDTILDVVRDFARTRGLSPYEPKRHSGLLRHLVLRHSRTTDEIIVVLLTTEPQPACIREIPGLLRKAVPSVVGFIWGLNTGVADIARLEKEVFSDGSDYITERLGDYVFRISAFSFFQTNTRGALRLYQLIRDCAVLDGNDVILDAFCGTGTIGIFCADACKAVYGIEIVPQAVWDARANAQFNNLKHCTFLTGDMGDIVPLFKNILVRPLTRLIVDPPRGGMDKKSLKALVSLDVPIIIYVSCNPTTLSRDMQFFSEYGYRIDKLQPVDMFPHTYHIESVARLVSTK